MDASAFVFLKSDKADSLMRSLSRKKVNLQAEDADL